jgi:hypothetical protein
LPENYDWNKVITRLSVDIPDPSDTLFSNPFGTQHFSQTQQIPMDHVPQYDQQWDPQYGQQYDPAQYGFPSGPGESSHIQDNAAESADVFPRVLINTLKTILKDGLQAHNLLLSILSGVESTRNGI